VNVVLPARLTASGSEQLPNWHEAQNDGQGWFITCTTRKDIVVPRRHLLPTELRVEDPVMCQLTVAP